MNYMQSYSTPPRRHTRFLPTERFSERKRNLFPSLNKENDNDSDLGMSPLEISSSPDRNDSPSHTPSIRDILSPNHRKFTSSEKFSALFENVTPIKQYHDDKENVGSPVVLAPSTPTPPDSPLCKGSSNIIIPETPSKVSPTQALKTPHECSSVNAQLPRLVRKSLDLSMTDKSHLKRKPDSPDKLDSCNKSLKLDSSFSKNPKARTALFTENVIPAKSFYPKSAENYKPGRYVFTEPLFKTKNNSKKVPTMYLCSRKKNKRRQYGQINAGVRHGIKKPKNKPKLSKTQMMKAASDILKNSPLNTYLDELNTSDDSKNINDQSGNDTNNDLTEIKNLPSMENNEILSNNQVKTMDSILKNISTNANSFVAQPLMILSREFETIEEQKQSVTAKRPLSPQRDHNRKFFKSSRTSATVTINKNIKLKIDNGEMSLMERKNKKKKLKFSDIHFDASDLTISEEQSLGGNSFLDILKSLEDDRILNASDNNIVLTAHESVSASENSILLHSEPTRVDVSNMLLSPTTLMCDMTSGLALNSPKGYTTSKPNVTLANSSKKRISFPDPDPVPEISIDLSSPVCINTDTQNPSENIISFPDTMAESQDKLFPIFYGNANTLPDQKSAAKESQAVVNLRKIWKPMSDDQTTIDAGQKRFGHTQCSECKLVYHIADPDDEIMHYNYHHAVNILKFNGWKNERIVSKFSNGKVILINPNDPKVWWRKVKDLLTVVNRDLGFVDVELDTCNSKVYLYILNKEIAGCLVAEPKRQAHKMLSLSDVDCCSEESFPVLCGVSRIWVSHTHRRQSVATNLMNTMRCNFIYGHILAAKEVAFSAPSDLGKKFATKYMKTDQYLIYTS